MAKVNRVSQRLILSNNTAQGLVNINIRQVPVQSGGPALVNEDYSIGSPDRISRCI